MRMLNIFFFAQFLFSLGQGFMESYWKPPGCVACIRAADKHFLKGVISQKPDCVEAKKKYTEFKAIGSASYMMFNICKENDKEEFQSRLKAMTTKAKEVLKSFEKCIQKDLDFGQKSAIKDYWEKFEKERGECEDTKHLSKEIQRFWDNLPYTGPMESIWGVTPENVDLISSLVV